jgi:hypothetical protein
VHTIEAFRRPCFDEPNSRSQHPHRRPRRSARTRPGQPAQRGDEDETTAAGVDVRREPGLGVNEEWDERGGDQSGAGRHAAPEGV